MTNLDFQKHLLLKKRKPIGEVLGFSYFNQEHKDYIIKVFKKAALMEKGQMKYLNKKLSREYVQKP